MNLDVYFNNFLFYFLRAKPKRIVKSSACIKIDAKNLGSNFKNGLRSSFRLLNKNKALKPKTIYANKKLVTKIIKRKKTIPRFLTKLVVTDSDSGIDMSDACRLVKKSFARNKLSS